MDTSRLRKSDNVEVRNTPTPQDELELTNGEELLNMIGRQMMSGRGQLQAFMDGYGLEKDFDRIIRDVLTNEETGTPFDISQFKADTTPLYDVGDQTPHRLEDHVYTTATPSGPRTRKY